MIQVTNAIDNANILISGMVGESMFGEGFTLESLKNQIPDDVPNVTVDLKTLGGDSSEALAIYDYLRAIPAKVTTRIVGRTASAGATIYMAGDVREISDNSDFLIHRGSTITIGNIDDHEKAIEVLDEHDSRIANIYQKGTGKRKSQIESLMKTEKFINADEAIKWGFAHKKIKSQKPILNQINMDTTELKKVLGVETDEAIPAAVTNLVTRVSELQSVVDQHTAQAEAAKELEISNYVTEAITAGKITATVKDSMINLAKTDFEAVKNIIETAKPAPLVNLIDEGKEPETKMTKEEATKIYNSWKLKNKVGRMAQDDPDKYMEVRNALKG